MTVKELMNHLKNFPTNVTIIMASDEEGNSYFHTSSPELGETYDGKEVVILYPEWPEVEM
ncbi:MAG: hypothetical protein WC554_08480 [Clostridia bacterium]